MIINKTLVAFFLALILSTSLLFMRHRQSAQLLGTPSDDVDERKALELRRNKITVQLRTTPNDVNVTIDGIGLSPGQVITTPTTLYLEPGQHTVRISSEGYVSSVVRVEGTGGDQFHISNIVLEPAR